MASVVKIDSLVVEKKSKMLQVYRPMDKRMLDKSSHKPSAHLSYKTPNLIQTINAFENIRYTRYLQISIITSLPADNSYGSFSSTAKSESQKT